MSATDCGLNRSTQHPNTEPAERQLQQALEPNTLPNGHNAGSALIPGKASVMDEQDRLAGR